ncbi:MAG: hypothetical protein J0I84_03805 [Terrimonas sp.]|nr:hypothetical protein [Terrimonas sp.]
MKNILFIIAMMTSGFAIAQSQVDTTIKVDLLNAPASPASNLLGIAPSDIDKPTDVSAFMLSLQSASNSFTKLPSNYAIDIAPYWLFKNSKKGDITTEGFRRSGGKDVLKQTLVLSFAIRSPDTTQTTTLNAKSTYGGFGFKFSILRGEYDNSTKQALDKIKQLQDKRLRHLDDMLTGYKANVDPVVMELRQKRKDMLAGKSADEVRAVMAGEEYNAINNALNKKLADYYETEKGEKIAELDKEIQQIASGFQTFRTGFTWDVAGGVSTEFRNQKFNNSKIYNAGIWTTIGYTDTIYGAGLFILRLLHNPDQVFAKDNMVNDIGNITTFDAGLRYIYAKPQSKFSASVEAVYRSVLSSNTIDPSWRIVFNADYKILENQKLTFSIGRNFDGTLTKDGNLIAALTFLKGFGNKR